jgi:hypothetical protein
MLRSVLARALEGSLATWWGFAEADRTLLGLVVAVLVLLSLVYLATRMRHKAAARSASLRARRQTRDSRRRA